MTLRGVLLDVDGTLVLSNDQHAQAWELAFREHGYEVPFERIRPLMGMGGDKLMPTVVPGLNDEEGPGKEIAARRKEIFKTQFVQKLQSTSGARELVQRIREAGLKYVIASSATNEELEGLLKAAQVEDLIKEATTSSDAEESKPAPDIVGAATQRIGVEPQEAILIGDTPYDIESAHGAGVPTIALRSGGFSDEQLKDAVAIYDDPADLLAHWDESPLSKH